MPKSENPLFSVEGGRMPATDPLERVTASNPAATGSAGSAFEAKVGAACLTLLLTRGAPLCLGAGTLHTVHLQAGHLGWRTDDILLEATNTAGEPVKAALQVKRAFELSVSNRECVKTLRGALADFRNSAQFDQRRDVVCLVPSSLSAKLARGLRTLLDCARASTSAGDLARRLAIPDNLGKPTLGYLETVREILTGAEGGAPSEAELWRFLTRFHVVDLDLNVPGGMTETMMRSLLAATLPDGDPNAAHATWNELVTLALSEAGSAMSYTREKLPLHLLQRHGRPTGYLTGVVRLLEDTEVVIAGICTTIGNKAAIPRQELFGELCQLIEEVPLVFVTGEAGSGKSALVKAAFTTATQGGIGFAFRAVSLAGNHVNEVLHRFGLTLDGLRAQTAMHTRKVLWVDSLEQLMEKSPEQRAASLDLLRALKSDPTWRLVVTCRDYSAETVRTAFFSEVGLTPADIEVGDLSDDELDDLATVIPSLQRPLSNKTLRRLLRNPFLLDKAAQMDWPATEPLPTNERAFREKVWREVIRRGDEDAETGLPQLRGQAMVAVALNRAKALEPFVPAANLDPRALHRLVRDSLLNTPAPGSDRYAPAHDVFEDWALVSWLDNEFTQHGRELSSLVTSLGTYPALRRAYRKWLTESLDADARATDSLVLALIQNPAVAAHWREDTLVGVLQSADASGFLRRNTALLLGDGAKLLRQVIHILRVGCRVAIPRRLFGLDSDGEFFLPKGNGWVGAAELLEAAIPQFSEADFMLVLGFMEDWILLTRWGLRYPKGARSIAKVAWHWLPRVPWRSPVRDGEERLLKVILAIPLTAEPELTTMVQTALADDRRNRANSLILDLPFNHFVCDPVVRDLPDLAFRVAEHLLGLDRSLEEVLADRSGHDMNAVSHAFGLGRRLAMGDFPASACHGPYLRMLWHHPNRAIDFVLRLTNRASEAYAHSDNRYEYIERPGTVTIQLTDGVSHEQIANGRLWGAYRGMGVAPECFQSALMALEHWLLEKANRGDPDVETVLVDLLRRSNNVAVTAVVASVATAYPTKAGAAAYSLLTSPFFLKVDLERSASDAFHTTQMFAARLPPIDAEKSIYDKERAESAKLPHRQKSLENLAVILQMSPLRERVCALIDSYKAELPPETEHDHETRVWRLRLHVIGTRNFLQAGETGDGRILFQASVPPEDLQQVVEDQRPRSSAFQAATTLFVWGRSTFDGQGEQGANPEDWRGRLTAAKEQLATADDNLHWTVGTIRQSGPAYVAALCIRDHWPEMPHSGQEWCAVTVCDAVEADADTRDHFVIAGRNPMEASRPAAFILPALFGKLLPAAVQARLLPALAKSVMHAVEETVSYAVQGIGCFLWRIDRSLALTCIEALVTKALEEHAFWERQRMLSFGERETEERFVEELRLKLRRFIEKRGACDEARLLHLDPTNWPGRAVARHLFAILGQQSDDPLALEVIRRNIAILPARWEDERRNRRDRSLGSEERLDPGIEHLYVETICRFVLRLPPAEALHHLEPIFSAAARFPEKAADFVNWLVLGQGNREPAPTFWALWQRFADDFVSGGLPAEVDDERSDAGKLLRELFLGANWGEQRDWPPLHGEAHRLQSLFERLPATQRGFECYAYFLAKVGSQSLPEPLVIVASKLAATKGAPLLSETAVFYLEEILSRLVYSGTSRVRAEPELRTSTLVILDHLVAAASSVAYKLRDDFLTPLPRKPSESFGVR